MADIIFKNCCLTLDDKIQPDKQLLKALTDLNFKICSISPTKLEGENISKNKLFRLTNLVTKFLETQKNAEFVDINNQRFKYRSPATRKRKTALLKGTEIPDNEKILKHNGGHFGQASNKENNTDISDVEARTPKESFTSYHESSKTAVRSDEASSTGPLVCTQTRRVSFPEVKFQSPLVCTQTRRVSFPEGKSQSPLVWTQMHRVSFPEVKSQTFPRKGNTSSTGYAAGEYTQNTGQQQHSLGGGQHDKKGRHSDADSSVYPTSQFSIAYKSNQPDGFMTYDYKKDHSFRIIYEFPDGEQKDFHPNPGKQYNGLKQTAYLPWSEDGLHVLKLFRLAFLRRKTFTIDGKTNNIKWNGIFHKTELGTGKFGLQDPEYLPRIRRDLEKRGISLQQTNKFEKKDIYIFCKSLRERGYFSSMAP